MADRCEMREYLISVLKFNVEIEGGERGRWRTNDNFVDFLCMISKVPFHRFVKIQSTKSLKCWEKKVVLVCLSFRDVTSTCFVFMFFYLEQSGCQNYHLSVL